VFFLGCVPGQEAVRSSLCRLVASVTEQPPAATPPPPIPSRISRVVALAGASSLLTSSDLNENLMQLALSSSIIPNKKPGSRLLPGSAYHSALWAEGMPMPPSNAVSRLVRASRGLPTTPESQPTVSQEGPVSACPSWSFSKKHSSVTRRHLTYDDGSCMPLLAPLGLPSPSFAGSRDVILFYRQRDVFIREYAESSTDNILQPWEIAPENGGASRHFHRGMDRAFRGVENHWRRRAPHGAAGALALAGLPPQPPSPSAGPEPHRLPHPDRRDKSGP
jgi:hypothetical protein